MNRSNHKYEHVEQRVVKIEANLDDMSGEWLGFLIEKLLKAGANDVYYTSVYMKKNRPGILLSVLVSLNCCEKIKKIIFTETTTFGLRYSLWDVHRLGRDFIIVQTKWGEIRVKRAYYKGVIIQESPEYEECKMIADRECIPIKKVYEQVYRELANI